MAKSLLESLDEEFGLGPLESGERRTAARRSCVAPAVLVPCDEQGRPDEAARRDGIAVDVSERGLRVVARTLRDSPRLEVRIPRSCGGWISLRGEVVRRRDLPAGYRELGLRLDTRTDAP